MIIVEREFSGKEELEEVLLTFIEYVIDKIPNASYDSDRTNVTPKSKGVAE